MGTSSFAAVPLAATAAAPSKGSSLTPLLLLLALGAFTYFVLIRPQRNRMKQLRQTQATLTAGVEVMTTAGLYATVVSFDDETVTLETSPGVHNRYARAAVARILTPGDDPAGAVDGDAAPGE
ncbi:MAG: preprotein translocase subunit YajC [Actinomycetota bacterium]|nr:preprotein translocase subunit YajC [Actinomycetota bacterium]